MIFTYFIYFFILIFGSVFSFCVEKTKNLSNEIFFRFLLFLVFFIPAAIRYNIAADYANYKLMYDNGTYWAYAEIGFCIICQLLKNLNCSSFWMFFTIAAITHFLICFCIKKNNFFIFIFFYIAFYGYFNTFDQIRQALALPFIIFSFYSIFEKNYIKTLFYIIIASLFHKSSIIFVFLLPFIGIKVKKYILITFTIILSMLLLQLNYVILLNNISDITNIRYILLFKDSITKTASFGLGLLLKIAYPIFYICTLPKYEKDIRIQKQTIISSNFGALYIIISFIVLKIDIFNRLRDVIWVGVLFSTTCIPKSRYRKIIIYFVLLSGIALYYIAIKNSSLPGTKLLSPYRTIFDNF